MIDNRRGFRHCHRFLQDRLQGLKIIRFRLRTTVITINTKVDLKMVLQAKYFLFDFDSVRNSSSLLWLLVFLSRRFSFTQWPRDVTRKPPKWDYKFYLWQLSSEQMSPFEDDSDLLTTITFWIPLQFSSRGQNSRKGRSTLHGHRH